MALTRSQLDQMQCQDPTCDRCAGEPLIIGPRCHLGAATRVTYEPGSGVAVLRCAICRSFVADLVVGDALRPAIVHIQAEA